MWLSEFEFSAVVVIGKLTRQAPLATAIPGHLNGVSDLSYYEAGEGAGTSGSISYEVMWNNISVQPTSAMVRKTPSFLFNWRATNKDPSNIQTASAQFQTIWFKPAPVAVIYWCKHSAPVFSFVHQNVPGMPICIGSSYIEDADLVHFLHWEILRAVGGTPEKPISPPLENERGPVFGWSSKKAATSLKAPSPTLVPLLSPSPVGSPGAFRRSNRRFAFHQSIKCRIDQIPQRLRQFSLWIDNNWLQKDIWGGILVCGQSLEISGRFFNLWVLVPIRCRCCCCNNRQLNIPINGLRPNLSRFLNYQMNHSISSVLIDIINEPQVLKLLTITEQILILKIKVPFPFLGNLSLEIPNILMPINMELKILPTSGANIDDKEIRELKYEVQKIPIHNTIVSHQTIIPGQLPPSKN
nr:hypothetical protein Iba_chr15bCG5980 [Ipomoea batatas]